MVQAVYAATINETAIDITMTNDQTTYWEVTITYDENVTRSDYFVLSTVRDIEVFSGDEPLICDKSQEGLGTLISCNNINTRKVTYLFSSRDFVSSLQDFKTFSYRFPVSQPTDKMSLILRLPLGTGIAEKNDLEGTGLNPFEPVSGIRGSDGRRITLTWDFKDPRLGDAVDVSVIFEQVSFQPEVESILIIVLIVFVIAVTIIFMHYFRKNRVRDILPVLNESERNIVKILLREKKEVDQRKIVKELDYSKSKISRAVRDLEKRGLIEKKQKGRTNLIKLAKGIKKEPEEKKSEEQKKIDKILGKEE
jgi:DNA-binding MarR family transcriptional regulator